MLKDFSKKDFSKKDFSKKDFSKKDFSKKYEDIKEEDIKNIKHKRCKDYNRKLIVFLLHKHKDDIKNKCALISDKELTEDEIEMMIEKKREMELCYNKIICDYKEDEEYEEYEEHEQEEDE
jgi:hypothetical protein